MSFSDFLKHYEKMVKTVVEINKKKVLKSN